MSKIKDFMMCLVTETSQGALPLLVACSKSIEGYMRLSLTTVSNGMSLI